MNKRILILFTLLILLAVPMTSQPNDSQASDLDCVTDTECEQRESRIDRQIRLVSEQAARTGWIDESKERD